MRFKSNISDRLNALPPWGISSIIHSLAVVVALVIVFYKPSKRTMIEVSVIEKPVVATQKPVTPPPLPPKAPPKPPPLQKRAVFGVSRKAITSDAPESTETVKLGNTVAKDPDAGKLRASDADSLPIPADEFMVTAMPVLQQEVRAPYPPEAKQKGIQGSVILDVLVDSEGKVRDVKIVSGPGFGMEAAAAEAMKQFKFKPAVIENQTVAVRIRYTYRFELERG